MMIRDLEADIEAIKSEQRQHTRKLSDLSLELHIKQQTLAFWREGVDADGREE